MASTVALACRHKAELAGAAGLMCCRRNQRVKLVGAPGVVPPHGLTPSSLSLLQIGELLVGEDV